ncbi:hypothetical protein LH991_01195 [Schleiferilactobacillus harbinensis]|uniref:Uncharacterized protein n=1 Tax=Schleiferilactobacillus harbinensis DSM 16991 TaxID=1122147 RepID=A0A0R1XBT1_9LACO|nr:hypothetical protein [Schleiferilactobacillus harbinensis]KRM27544.1 hypothetical protein FC91_GL002460 [Schleiferilactobacillus harbinensis DSM 16991]QFR62702.1 hypothetical protein LH991_01195 [Schleiferilactobacillus harbinensis]
MMKPKKNTMFTSRIGRLIGAVLLAGVLTLTAAGIVAVHNARAATDNSTPPTSQADTGNKNDDQSDDSSGPSNGDSNTGVKEVSGQIVPVDPYQQSLKVPATSYGPVQEGTSIDVPVVAGYYPEDSQDVDSLVVGVQVQVPKEGGTIYVTYLPTKNPGGDTGGNGGTGSGSGSSSGGQSSGGSSTPSSTPSTSTSQPSSQPSSSSTSSDTPKIPDGPRQNKSTSSKKSSSTTQQASGQDSDSAASSSSKPWYSWFTGWFSGNKNSQSSSSSATSSKKGSTSSSAKKDSADNDSSSQSAATHLKSAAGKTTKSHTQWLAIGITVVSAALLGGVLVLLWRQRRKS